MSNKAMLFLSLPEIVSIPLYFTSQQTHLVCWFTPENSFMGGPLRYLPYIIFGFYSLTFLINNFVYFKNYSKIYNLIVAFITIGPFIGVFYYMYSRKDNDYCALFTSSILLYYICIYIHMAKIDPLTELLNRQSFYQDLRSNARIITAVVSADMNELKFINDNKGHEAGDTALKTVSGIIRDNCGSNGTVYRIGGDEFIILYINTDEEEIKASIEAIRNCLSETSYSCAFGYAMNNHDEDISKIINKADHEMYEDKAVYRKGRVTYR
jgi:diguanylate cyclase (GGDEF)-like protein